VKNYAVAVQLDIDALTARTKRTERFAAFDGAAKSREPIIRKTITPPVRLLA
jgi:hypothetical protein